MFLRNRDFSERHVNQQIYRSECFQFGHEKITSLRGIMLTLINNLIEVYRQNKNNNDMIPSIDDSDSMSVTIVNDGLETLDESTLIGNKMDEKDEKDSNQSHKTDEDSGKTNENIGKGRDRGTCTEKHNNALNVTPFASMIKSSIEQSLK